MPENIQQAFVEFHSTIKLYIDDNQFLIDKRDLLIEELKTYFQKKFEKDGIKIKFKHKNQGSYSMGTGIKPLDTEDYDIDVMILFEFSKDDYTAKEVKKWVFEALDKYPRNVEILKPCVRVQYHKAGETHYHVDLALYSTTDGIYLAKKPKLKSDDEVWEESNPEELKKLIAAKFEDKEERHQFKRVITYLKRWKDIKFKNTKNGKPTGISITALAYEGFISEVNYDSFNDTYKPDDLKALRKMVEYIISQFSWFSGDIEVQLPVEPFNDLFSKMSIEQKKNLKSTFETLRDKLIEAEEETDPNKASNIIIKVLGDDFPEIPKQDSAQSRPKAFASSPDQA